MTKQPCKIPPRDTEIAVVGMACRFPGIRTPRDLWAVLVEGKETIATFSDDQLRASGIPETLFKHPDYVPRGAALGDIDLFDAGFFGFSPREAALLDPQCRLFLETAWHALEDGGFANDDPERDIGVFGGVALNTYFHNNLATNPKVLEDFGFFQTLISNDKDYLTTLVSYKLNLTGPAITVQTACSTSLVAIHTACQSLLTGECDLALAGGVNLTVPEAQGYLYQTGMINSPDGSCRPFCEDAAGTTNGAGCGMVLLQPLADAIDAGATIHAIIRGSAINNDGARKVGYTAPGLEGQVRAISEAQRIAEVDPTEIGFVETHGTATPLGDPIEVSALVRVWAGTAHSEHLTDSSCVLGAVKSNLGHTGAAAGVAGFMKAVLAVREGALPGTVHFTRPHPELDLDKTPFQISAQFAPWKISETQPERIAGVSSFGIGGTNAHVILAENRFAPQSAPATARKTNLLTLSAHSPEALEQACNNLAEFLDEPDAPSPGAVAHTLQTGRKALPYRLTINGEDHATVVKALRNATITTAQTAASEKRRVAFMMTGHGSQSTTMTRALLAQEPVFRKRFDELASVLKTRTNIDLYAVLTSSDPGWAQSQLDRMMVSQPLMYVIQLALCALWKSWGVTPETVIGHSSGEFAAAFEAGIFSAEDGLKLVLARGQLMDTSIAGGMIALNYDEHEIKHFIGSNLSVGVINAPDMCVVSGEEKYLNDFITLLEERDVDYRRLHVSRAAHSPTMEAIQPAFAEIAKTIRYRAPETRYISSVTGKPADPDEIATADYWVKHLRTTVRFGEAVGHLVSDPEIALVEIGPGNALSTFARITAGAKGAPAPICVQSLARPQDKNEHDDAVIAASLGRLWACGVAIDWKSYRQDQLHHLVSLPTLPLQRQRCWIDPPGMTGHEQTRSRSQPTRQPDPERWFHVPGWKSAPRPVASVKIPGKRTVLWLDAGDDALVDKLTTRLAKNDDCQLIRVTTGDAFDIAGNAATIRRNSATDYEALIETTAPAIIIQTASEQAAADDTDNIPGFDTFHSLCHLGRALALRPDLQTDIITITTGVFDVTGTEELSPANNMALGPLKVIPQECPNVRTHLLDLDPASDVSAYAAHIEDAIRQKDREPIRVVRGRHQWVPAYSPVQLGETSADLGHIREGGVYVISGGLGGLGLTIAEHFARIYKAKLGLISRSPLPKRKDWNDDTLRADKADIIDRLLAMEEAGAEIRTFALDCADQSAMADTFDEIETSLGPINGVIHAAGDIGFQIHGALDQYSPQQARSQFNAKVRGTNVLEKLLACRRPDFVILMSSMAAVFGGLGFAAYGAACAYMDAVATKHSGKTSTRWISINWDRWIPAGQEEQETGLQNRTLANLEMRPDEGMSAFLRVLKHLDGPQVLVTPGNIEDRLSQWINLGPRQAKPVSKYVSSASMMSEPQSQTIKVASETITDVQAKLAGIWQRLLGHPKIGLDDNFFDLGGHSLLATRVLDQIRQHLGTNLPMRTLFDTPTIRGLASVINKDVGRSVLPRTSDSAPPRQSAGSPAPLTEAQKQLWLVDNIETGTGLYTIPIVLRFRGPLSVAALENAVSSLIERHEALRMFCYVHDDVMMQGFAKPYTIKLPVEDVSSLELGERIATESQIHFDLAKAPLFHVKLLRISRDEHVFVMVLHHITADGWSVGLLLKDLSALYRTFEQGKTPSLPELAWHYSQYANWQANQLNTGEIDRQLEYWRKQLANMPTRHALPTDRPLPNHRTFSAGIVGCVLPRETATRLRHLTEAEGASLFMVTLAAFAALLTRLTGVSDQPVITSSANRTESWQEEIAGLFVAMLVLRPQPRGDQVFRDLVREVRAITLDAFANSDVPLQRIVEALNPPRHPGQHPLSQIGYVVQNMPFEPQSPEGLEIEYMSQGSGASQYDLLCSVSEVANNIHIDIEYSCELFDKRTVETFLAHFVGLISIVAETPDTRISDISLITRDEEAKLLRWGNALDPKPGISSETLSDMVRTHASGSPKSPALTFGSQVWSYGELMAQVENQSNALRKLGVSARDIVAVSLPRGPERVIAFLAILDCNAVYLPLDPAQPVKRLAMIRKDAAPVAEITPDGIKTLKSGTPNFANLSEHSDIAYVIYTSGSTGQPKGVVIGHEGLSALTLAQRDLFATKPGDRILQLAAPSFDAWIWEVSMALGAGATLVTASDDAIQAGPNLIGFLYEQAITHLTITPPALSVLPHQALPDLQTLICAGATLPPKLAKLWGQGRKLYNAYGPTEVTVCATVGICDTAAGKFNIGKPLSHLSVHILDPEGNPAPPGTAGELYVGGIGLALGYLGRSDLTKERFVKNPVARGAHDRLYATGDRARFLPDGSGETADIVFMSRLDDQLEIRGFRVEPGEIEHCLLKHPNVAQATVVGFPYDNPDRLLAYVLMTGDAPPDGSTLRGYVADILPKHMLPSLIIALDEFPLTVAGKIDLRSLSSLATNYENPHNTAPGNALEARLQKLWRDTLGIDMVSIETGFFEAGGTSLLAVQLVGNIQSAMDIDLSVSDLFAYPTIQEMAKMIEKNSHRNTTAMTASITVASDAPLAGSPDNGNPLFWFGGLGAHNMSLAPLASHLADDGPVYTLYPRGSDGITPPDNNVDIALLRFTETIRRIQPEGPYRIGGHSLGCKLAYLVANRLIAEGEKVKALCLLDGAAPDQNLYEDDTIPTEDMLRNFLIQKVSATTGGLLEDQAGFEDGELDRRVQALSAVMPLVMFQTGPENSPRDIPTLLITASRDDGLSGIAVETFGEDLGWNRFVKNPEIKQLDSTHDRLLTQPDLQEVVKLWKHFSANLQE